VGPVPVRMELAARKSPAGGLPELFPQKPSAARSGLLQLSSSAGHYTPHWRMRG